MCRIVPLLSLFFFLLTGLGCDKSSRSGRNQHDELDSTTAFLPDTSSADEASGCLETHSFPVSPTVWTANSQDDPSRDGDLTFDPEGRLVAADARGNIVRYDAGGNRTVWIENGVVTARGLAFLSTGELVVLDGGLASLVKFRPDGTRLVMGSDLDSPAGLAVDKEDFVYIADRMRSAVLRVHPVSGASEYIVTQLPVPPGALAFSSDSNTLYVAGYGNGTIYSLQRGIDGVFEPPRVFATVPGLRDPCAQQLAYDVCEFQGTPMGHCTPVHDGSLYCQSGLSCAAATVGNSCFDEQFGQGGVCRESEGKNGPIWNELNCDPLWPCAGMTVGDSCEVYVENRISEVAPVKVPKPGVCRQSPQGVLFCSHIGQCASAPQGAPCTTDLGVSGTCGVSDTGSPYCQGITDYVSSKGTSVSKLSVPPNGIPLAIVETCGEGVIGDNCTTAWGVPGECRDSGGDELFCAAIGPCYGLLQGSECTFSESIVGICRQKEGYLECVEPWFCDNLSVGTACITPFKKMGTCQLGDEDTLFCEEKTPCTRKAAKESCIDKYGFSGTCEEGEEVYDGQLICVRPPPCEGKVTNEVCADTFTNLPGRCTRAAGEQLVCQLDPPCANLSVGTTCKLTADKQGTCIDAGQGGELLCHQGNPTGKLNSLVVDACGNMFVTAAGSDSIWRISEDGRNVAPIAGLQRFSITGMTLGNFGDGGAGDRLYVSIEGGREIVTVPLGSSILSQASFDAVLEFDTSNDHLLTESFNCREIPPAPLATSGIDGAIGYHDLAIDTEGYMIGFDDRALVRVNAQGEQQVFAVGLNDVDGFDWLVDGSLVVSSAEGIVRIYLNGGQTKLATDVQSYGITIGPDEMIYAVDGNRVYRIHPDTGEKKVLLEPRVFRPRQVNFDPDYTVMYLTTLGDSKVYALPLDDEMNPAGEPVLFATIPNSGNHDGLGVDVCGNLYIVDFNTLSLYRVRPNGVVTQYLQWDSLQYGHGICWGNGVGGFNDQTIYLPQPYNKNTVLEVNIGVPSAH